jgi:hypothetical protein
MQRGELLMAAREPDGAHFVVKMVSPNGAEARFHHALARIASQ